jgi:hypothetical protein
MTTNPIFSNNLGNESSEKEQLFRLAIAEVFSTLDIELKSVLTQRQMVALVRLKVFALRFKSPMAETVYQGLIKTAVSTDVKGGRGRRDLTDVLKALINQDDQGDKKTQGLMRRILR